MSTPTATSVRLLIILAAATFGCGGKVVFVEDDGEGPQGGSPVGPGPSDGGAPPQVTGGSGNGGSGNGGSSVVGTPASPCQIACNTVFQCGLQPDGNGLVLCPGLEPGDQTVFVTGCAETCEQQMALVSLVDPNDCEGTIETLQTVSPDFDNTCKFGF